MVQLYTELVECHETSEYGSFLYLFSLTLIPTLFDCFGLLVVALVTVKFAFL